MTFDEWWRNYSKPGNYEVDSMDYAQRTRDAHAAWDAAKNDMINHEQRHQVAEYLADKHEIPVNMLIEEQPNA